MKIHAILQHRLKQTLLTGALLLLTVSLGEAKPSHGKSEPEKKPVPAQAEPATQSKPKTQPPTTGTPPETKAPVTPPTSIQPTPIQPIVSPNIDAAAATSAVQNPQAGETIKWQVISAGGVHSSSASYKMDATLGQTAAGMSTSASYKLSQGFWYASSFGCCVGIRGDANGNGALNVIDLNYLVAYFFAGGPVPPCTAEADANGNGAINVIDLNYLVAYFFAGGTPPPACP